MFVCRAAGTYFRDLLTARKKPHFADCFCKMRRKLNNADSCWILTMKHATPLAFSHPRAKRVCFDKDNGKASSFKPDAVPENHFHLGKSQLRRCF
ncbi:hypothetical protein TNCV_1052361 [Trichonephila clavipes]|nr:hypothetical protein TNCV_1052361 [Trichonephila clavipes]